MGDIWTRIISNEIMYACLRNIINTVLLYVTVIKLINNKYVALFCRMIIDIP